MARSAPETDRFRFEQLYRDTYPALLGYLLRRVSEPTDAADVLAETYLVAWRRIQDVPVGGDARPWLFGVARRALANHERSRRRRSGLVDRLRAQLPDLTAQSRGEPAGTADAAAIRAALRRLRPADREVLTLIAWEGLSREQVAIALDCSAASLRVRLHRARRRLAAALHAEGMPATAALAVSQTREVRP